MDDPVLITILCETFLNENDHCTLPIQLLSHNNVMGALFQLLHGKRWDVPRIEGYSERVIPRFISEDYRVHFRISKDMSETIHEAIQPKLIFEHRGGNEQISPRKQLLLFLCYMANNETFRELGQYFGVGKSTAHVCIARVLEAFCEIFLDVCIQILVGIRCILFFHRVH